MIPVVLSLTTHCYTPTHTPTSSLRARASALTCESAAASDRSSLSPPANKGRLLGRFSRQTNNRIVPQRNYNREDNEFV